MVRLRVYDEVSWDGKPVAGERPQALLRALADAGPRGLSEGTLVEEIWADEPPANPTKALQVVVSRARGATGGDAIERTARGYRLALSAGDVDAWALRPQGLELAAAGRYAEALPLLERAMREAETADDDLMVALIRAVAAVRGAPAALERYEGYRAHLAETLGVDPSPVLRALHAELLARDRPVRSGLRYDADRLIGRASDLAALRTLVKGHRLVSIVGAGGLGKTRLAHLAGREAEQPVVHFVELVSVTSSTAVAVEVADALGARESVVKRPASGSGRADPVTRIVDLVGAVPTLLILDNCEQVVDGVADLVSALLARTPRLTVLTTTRMPLGLSAERVYQLPELSSDDAVTLFEERARSARPGVVLDPERVRALVDRLDGLPLAVELAAAKVRVMSVEEIERRLDNRFALLRGGSRDAPARHQTLLAVIDWSWNLLSEEQRIGLRRLSLFRDGFSLDGASAVIASSASGEALEIVTQLVEQSLVVVRENGEVRYGLLETVREFGRMQLVDAGDDSEAQRLLSRWAVDLTTAAHARLFSREQLAAVGPLRAEEGNLVEVLRQAGEARDIATLAPVLTALTSFWAIEGAHLKVLNLGVPAAAVLAAEPIPPGLEDAERASLALTVMTGSVFTGGPDPSVLERLRDLGPGSEDPRLRATVTVVLAMAQGGPRLDPAGLFELAADADPYLAQAASMWASQAAENLGDLDGALAHAERSLSLVDDESGPWTRALLQSHLAALELQRGNGAAARACAEAAAPVMEAIGAFEDWAQVRAVVALVAIADGEHDMAEQIFDDLGDDDRFRGEFGGAISYRCGRAELLLARGRTDEGLAAYRDAIAQLASWRLPRSDTPVGFEPWVLFPQAVSLAAHIRHGQRPEASYDDLRAKLASMLSSENAFLDFPICGTALFALACWHLTDGRREHGALLLALAEGFSINRMLPSIDERWARQMAGELPAVPTDHGELRSLAIQTLRL